MFLYIGCNGHVAAIDPETGQEVWRSRLPGGFLGSSSCEDVCVLEHQGTVFAGCNGHLFALDGQTGQIFWENQLSGMGYNDVSLSMAGKSVQYFSSRGKS